MCTYSMDLSILIINTPHASTGQAQHKQCAPIVSSAKVEVQLDYFCSSSTAWKTTKLHESLQDMCSISCLYDQHSDSLYSYSNRAQLNGWLQKCHFKLNQASCPYICYWKACSWLSVFASSTHRCMCCRSRWRALVTDGGSSGFENISCKLQEGRDMTARQESSDAWQLFLQVQQDSMSA